MEDPKFESFQNKINNCLFRFLIREYYAGSINPFFCLKLLSKIIHSKIAGPMKLKCTSFLFRILKQFIINDLTLENIYPIINDALDNVLTRKSDYSIILQYAFFLIHIGKVDKAVTTLQIFSNHNRFMNSGELFFYKGLIEFAIEKKSDSGYFIKTLEKCIPLLKNDKYIHYEWIIDFFLTENLISDFKENIIQNEHIMLYLKETSTKVKIVKMISEASSSPSLKQLDLFADELITNFSDWTLFKKFCELLDIYYEDNFLSNRSDMVQQLNKILKINENYLNIYLIFLGTYFLYSPFHDQCRLVLVSILSEIKQYILHHSHFNVFTSPDNQRDFQGNMVKIYKMIVEVVFKGKLNKEILKLAEMMNPSRKKNINTFSSESCHNKLILILDVVKIVNLFSEIIFGKPFVVVDDSKLCINMKYTKELLKYIQSNKSF